MLNAKKEEKKGFIILFKVKDKETGKNKIERFDLSYIRVYLNQFMNFDSLRSLLAKANLNLSWNMVQKVEDFLQNIIGMTSQHMEQQAFSALGIMGQVQQMKPVNSGTLVGCGITIETVLRHLPKLSKESVLEVATRQCIKWREAPLWLSRKIDDVKIAYRIYKKYRAVFDKIAKHHCVIEDDSTGNLMAIFWIIFLRTKNGSQDGLDIVESSTMLCSLFIFIFAEVLADLTVPQIQQYFKEQFPETRSPNQQKYNQYRQQFLKYLNEIHEKRQKYQELNLQKLATDQEFMKRFLDDSSIIYQRFKVNLPRHSVDQISFLELDKSITPLAVKRDLKPEGPQQVISEALNFDDDDDLILEENKVPNKIKKVEQSVSENPLKETGRKRRLSLSQRLDPISPFRPLQSHHYNISPIRARHQNLGWINNTTSRDYEKDVENVKNIFQTYTHQSFEDYLQSSLKKITEAISEFTPSCLNFSKRQHSIFCFFSYVLDQIHEKHNQEERKVIFGKINTFSSILCLSVNLFNFAYQSLQSSYRQYCQIFGVGLIQCHITLNWLGVHIEMPTNLEGYLYDLEKKILIQEIWQQGEGYDLLTNPTNFYQGGQVFKRLKKHADERTQELCESMNINAKQIAKVVNLVRFILDKRKGLLKDHKIDQIIVCSIASIMSINRSKNFSLSQIFNHYNRLLHSLNISKSIFFREGREIDMIDYYNHVFLIQVEEIISNEEQAKNVLDTPVRLEWMRRRDKGQLTTPIPTKYRQPPDIAGFGLSRLKSKEERGGKYVNNLVNRISHSKITDEKEEENDNQEDPPSPSFGGVDQVPSNIPHNFSFRDSNKKD